MNIALVFLGGGLGALVRYLIGVKWMFTNIWTSTLVSNLIAALVIGLLYTLQNQTKNIVPSSVWLFTAVGFCGGLSTFSSFSLEIFQWMQQEKWMQCLVYILLNVVLCTLLIFATFKWWEWNK
jgi:fluoride exporter